jgi:hypothetical protein
MKKPSRRRLLTGIGTATAVAAAGCVSDNASEDDSLAEQNTPAKDENSSGDTPLPSSLQTGLSFIYPPVKEWTILRIDTVGRNKPDFTSMPPSVLHITEDSTVDRMVDIQGIGLSEDVPENPSPGTVFVGSIEIDEEDDEIEHEGNSRGFDRYRIPGDDNRGPIYFANNGEVLLADSKAWVDTTLDNRAADEYTYVESNNNVQELLGHLEPVGYHAVLEGGQSFIERQMSGREFELSTVPELVAYGAHQREGATTRVVAMWYPNSVGTAEKEEFPTLAKAEFGVRNADPETRADGQILFSETTE